MKCYVIATKWSEKEKKQVKFVAGEFDEYMNAHIFKEAYNEHYSADAHIVVGRKEI